LPEARITTAILIILHLNIVKIHDINYSSSTCRVTKISLEFPSQISKHQRKFPCNTRKITKPICKMATVAISNATLKKKYLVTVTNV